MPWVPFAKLLAPSSLLERSCTFRTIDCQTILHSRLDLTGRKINLNSEA